MSLGGGGTKIPKGGCAGRVRSLGVWPGGGAEIPRDSPQVCVYTTLFQTNPGSTRVEPTSGGGLELTRVEPGLAVFTRQKLTRIQPSYFNCAV